MLPRLFCCYYDVFCGLTMQLPETIRVVLFLCLALQAAGAQSIDAALPCDAAELTKDQLNTFATLSATQLEASSDAAKLDAGLQGDMPKRCADAAVGYMSSLLPLPQEAWAAVKAGESRNCAGPAGLGSPTPWYALCLPVTCLGHTDKTQALAWHVLWARLAPTCRVPAMPQHWPRGDGYHPQLLKLFSDGAIEYDEEIELDADSLLGAGGDGPYDVVTVTDKPDRARKLVGSVPWPLRLRFLRPASSAQHPWRFRFFDTERHLLQYVTHLRREGHGDRLVIYADAFDTVWLGCRRDLRKALRAIGRNVFFGVEFDMYPAGTRRFPLHGRSHEEIATRAGPGGGKLPFCRKEINPMYQWEQNAVDEHLPCRARVPPGLSAIHLNGGTYGGKAAALEQVLRRMLAHQSLLAEYDQDGRVFRREGRTHQFLWNQYFVDRPHEIGLDYGGAFTVNLASRSVVPRLFGMDRTSGLMKSVLFQRPVCIAHANGGGWADNTLSLLTSLSQLGMDTTTTVGPSFEEMEELAYNGVIADKDEEDPRLADRIIIDTSLCYTALDGAQSYYGVLSGVTFLTPYNSPTFTGLQFFLARPTERTMAGPNYTVTEVQSTAMFTTHGEPTPPPHGVYQFEGRAAFSIAAFRMRVRPGDCLAWRCQGRCDLAYKPVDTSSKGTGRAPISQGAWLARGKASAGAPLYLDRFLGRQYMLEVQAEVFGIGFYDPEDGG
eukprot:TRINITY_DN100583_c0_g1_i1.p1 TRINITY_DN100583_c0_g1~~TRINITY_DN100583_c0_g1_i1.p1  ORF type:complete len:720 (-),score=46.99 TRINITY_DN100583_c0_g1_i1:649-2808(-)